MANSFEENLKRSRFAEEHINRRFSKAGLVVKLDSNAEMINPGKDGLPWDGGYDFLFPFHRECYDLKCPLGLRFSSLERFAQDVGRDSILLGFKEKIDKQLRLEIPDGYIILSADFVGCCVVMAHTRDKWRVTDAGRGPSYAVHVREMLSFETWCQWMRDRQGEIVARMHEDKAVARSRSPKGEGPGLDLFGRPVGPQRGSSVRYKNGRPRLLDWEGWEPLAVLKMTGYALIKHRGLRGLELFHEACKLYPLPAAKILGRKMEYEELCRLVAEERGVPLTYNKVMQRFDKADRYEEILDCLGDVEDALGFTS